MKASQSVDATRYQLADFLLDTGQMTLLRAGSPTPLPLKAVRLLAALVQAYPGVVSHEAIQTLVWGKTRVSQASVAKLVSATRRYFAEQQLAFPVIQTVAGEGYRLAELCWSNMRALPPAEPEPAAESVPEPARPAAATAVDSAPPARHGAAAGPWVWSLSALAAMLLLLAYFAWIAEPALVRNEPPDTLARILWVDDHPENNRTEQAWLHSRRIAVYQVTSSEDARLALDLYPFELIISDMGRQQDPLAGFRLLAQLRQAGRQTPLLFYTLQVSPTLAAEVAERGGQGVADSREALYALVQSQLAALNLIPASAL